MLRIKVPKTLVLVEEKFEDHAKEKIGTHITMVGFRIASNF